MSMVSARGGSATLSNRRLARIALAAATALAAILPAAASPVSAVSGPLVVESTDTPRVDPDATSGLTGLSITGNDEDVLQATLATDVGTLSIPTQTGLTLAFGNSWSGTPSITFTGMMSDINNGLASAQITTPAGDGTANVSLTASVDDATRFFLPSNQRFYEYVIDDGISWTDADVAARARTFRGQPGYLAAPVDQTINDFLTFRIPDADDIWIGLRAYENSTVGDTSYPRVWRAVVGADQSPEQGTVVSICSDATGSCTFVDRSSYFESWSSGEPNNASNIENVAVTNWNDTAGFWNDLPPAPGGGNVPSGYVVEYGGKTNVDDPAVGTGFTGVTTDTSEVVIADAPAAPDAPFLTGFAADQAIELSWRPPSNGGAPITSYDVSLNRGAWEPLATSSETTSVDGNLVTIVSATLSGLTDGTPYDVRIRAVNSVGPSAASNTVSRTPTDRLLATSTSTQRIDPGATTGLAGLSIGGSGGSPTRATLSTDVGTLTIGTTTGLELAFDNNWSGDPSITFSGSEADINAALASATITTPAGDTTANVSLTAMPNDDGYFYLASEQRFFQFIAAAGIDWDAADAAARALTYRGQPGYLAAPVNAAKNDFVAEKIEDAANVWIGLQAYESGPNAEYDGDPYARVWRAVVGADQSPEAGTVVGVCSNFDGTCDFVDSPNYFESWNVGQPDNFQPPGGETVATTNQGGAPGVWNDLPRTNTTTADGYVVEYGGKDNADSQLGTGFAGVVTDTSAVLVAAAATEPDAPVVTGEPGDGSVTLTWTAPENGGAEITSYEASTNGGSWATIATTSTNENIDGNIVTTVSSGFTGLDNGTEYTLRVRAVNSVGASAASNTVTATPRTVPDAPTAATATPSDESVDIAFTAPADDGGSAITSYTATASPGGATGTCSASPCTVSDLTNGTTYTFTVTATNAAGDSDASTPSAAVTPRTTPGAPTDLDATPGDESISLAFTAPADDGGSAITDYTATASPGGATGTCSTSPCTVSGLTNGTTYTFTVTATNAAGDSDASTPSAAVTPRTTPSAPTDLDATPGDESISLAFTAPADDGGSAITDYTVTGSPGDIDVDCAGSPCTISGLTNGTEYTLTIAATNDAGDGPGSSATSTPRTTPGAPTDLIAARGNRSVSIAFTPPADDGGDTITEYTATATPGGATGSCSASPCRITGLTNGTEYTLTIAATNDAGDGPDSTPTTATPASTLPPPPPPPAEVTVTSTATTVTVTFDTTNPGTTSHTVTLEPGPITVTCTASPCTIDGLTPGIDYAVSVAANGPGGSTPAATGPVDVITDRSVGGFVPMRPTRALDSRSTERFTAGEVREIDLSDVDGLPNDASSVVVNLTAVNPDASGFMSVVPCDTTDPTTSNLNFTAGADVAGSAIVDISETMTFCVYTHVGTDVVIDVNGAISPTAGQSRLHGIEPRRAFDTRELGLTARADSVQRVSLAGLVPADADAVVLNTTVVNARASGYATVFDCAGAPPTASNLNFVAGQTVPNAVTTALGDDAEICVYSLAEIDLVVDVMAYYAVDPTVDAIVPIAAERLVDTRDAGTRLQAGEFMAVDMPQRDGRSPVAGVVNLTSTQSATTGYLTAHPCLKTPPLASNLNPVPGVDIANSATVITDDAGRICVFSSTDTHLIIDLLGLQY